MFGTWRNRTYFYFDRDEGGGGANDPALPVLDPSKAKPVEPSTEDEELTDEEFEALPPKVKARIEKERAKASEESAVKAKNEVIAEQKKAEAEARRKKATENNDTAEQLRLIQERAEQAEAKLAEAETKAAQSADLNTRLKIVADYKLPKGYEEYLGTDPTKYEANAKVHQKNLKPTGSNPSLEGGNQNNPTTKEQQDASAKKYLTKFRAI